jgi:hypothetical protein
LGVEFIKGEWVALKPPATNIGSGLSSTVS